MSKGTLPRTFAAVFILLLIALITFAFALSGSLSRSQQKASTTPTTTVIIDAGHGGEDGGAVGDDGSQEKSIVLDDVDGITLAVADGFDLFVLAVVRTLVARPTFVRLESCSHDGIVSRQVFVEHDDVLVNLQRHLFRVQESRAVFLFPYPFVSEHLRIAHHECRRERLLTE